jgi:arabinofuranosyltransferase
LDFGLRTSNFLMSHSPLPPSSVLRPSSSIFRPPSSVLRPSSFLLLSFLSVLLYLTASSRSGFLGFPLDDAWIYQTYARNLATLHQFAFIPGQPSAGSTSPLWSGLLALGYLLRVDYHVWTYALGALLLGLNAWLVYRLTLNFWPEHKISAMFAGLFIALEWHLVWAAASGMETLLFSAFGLSVFAIGSLDWERRGRPALWLGGLAGLSVLARPDGLTLLPFAVGYAVFHRPQRLRHTLECLAGFAVTFILYLSFNQMLGGSFWPNTFYAKQAEYAVLRSAPLLTRLGQVGALPFVGAQALFLPGIVATTWLAARSGQRRWRLLLPLSWAISFILAYTLRLPVTYQHGRYLIPLIPVLTVLGVGGMGQILHLSFSKPIPRIISRAWLMAVGLLAIIFWFIGAGAYARDTQIIETEMVATARWINQNTPASALIAAHDIGALGYFGQRKILDMAGLVSPQVIPFIRDEARLQAWLTDSGADYLVTFPGWYPTLTRPLAAFAVFRTQAPFSPVAGGENMVVYKWPAR